MRVRTISMIALLGVFIVSIFAPVAALASSKGRRNTALALTAGALYALYKGKKTAGVALAAGSAYAWKRYNDSRRAEVRKKAYRSGYSRGYKYGYRNGKRYAFGKSKKMSRHYVKRDRSSRYLVTRR